MQATRAPHDNDDTRRHALGAAARVWVQRTRHKDAVAAAAATELARSLLASSNEQ
jgi:hypothetical protein